jgi:hypothetical protein
MSGKSNIKTFVGMTVAAVLGLGLSWLIHHRFCVAGDKVFSAFHARGIQELVLTRQIRRFPGILSG